MKKILLIVPLILLLSGCYSYRELNDLAIVSGVSVSMEDDKFKVALEVVNPKKMQDASNSDEPDFFIYTSVDKSLQEAFRNIIKESPKKAYASHVEVLVIDESVCKNNLGDILDFFARDPEVRNEFYVLISRDDDVLKVTTPLENISSTNIIDSMESNSKYLGVTNLLTYYDLISNYLNPNIELALPSIEVIGDASMGEETENIKKTSTDASIVLANISVFKDNKLLGYLNKDESIVYNFVRDNIKTTLIRNEYDNGEYVVNEIIDAKTKMKADIEKNKITISINGKASISEANYSNDLSKAKNIEKINDDLNNNIEKMVKENIYNIINKYNSDIFGFGQLYYKTDPKYFDKIRDKWYSDYFSNIDIDVKSKITIFEKGNLNGDIYVQ